MNSKIEINNVSYEYPRGRRVFNNLNLELNKGETTVLTGKNGCGKTTLAKLIMGILQPTFDNWLLFWGCNKIKQGHLIFIFFIYLPM
jgi:Fe-S cluster assembly ATP-binding protein